MNLFLSLDILLILLNLICKNFNVSNFIINAIKFLLL